MANRLYKAPAVRVTPGVPGTPPTPAYCIDEPVYVDYGSAMQLQTQISLTEQLTGRKVGQNYYTEVGGRLSPAVQGIDPALTQMFTGAAIGSSVHVAYILRTCYPARPGTPAVPPKINYDSLPGWNSGGLSVGYLPGNGYFEFIIGPSSIGAIVGLNSQSDTVSPADCSHAFYGHQGLLDIIEDGAIVASVAGGLAGRPVLRIARSGRAVRYLVNGVVVHTSSKPSVGFARLDASLYMAGDYVDDPRFASYQTGSAAGSVGVSAAIDLRPRATGSVGVGGYAVGRAGDKLYGAASGGVGITVLPAAGYGENHGTAAGDVGVQGLATPAQNKSHGIYRGALGIASDRAYSMSAGVYRGGYRGESLGGFPEISFSGAAGFAPQPLGFAYGPSGGVATSAGVGPAPQGAAGENGYAFVRSTYRGGYHGLSYEPFLDSQSILLREPILLEDRMHLAAEVWASFATFVEVADGAVIELELSEGFSWFDTLLVSSSMAETGDRFADFADAVAVTTQANIPGREGIQYATNTLTGAITRYTGFDFMAMTITPYGSFGVREDGVYRLGRGGDDGEGVDIAVDFGANQFGTNRSKRMEAIYFGLTTDGDVLAVVKADDGAELSYRVVNREPMMRAVTAKGVEGKSWRLSLKVYEATQAELDSVEFLVGASVRRLSGGRR